MEHTNVKFEGPKSIQVIECARQVDLIKKVRNKGSVSEGPRARWDEVTAEIGNERVLCKGQRFISGNCQK